MTTLASPTMPQPLIPRSSAARPRSISSTSTSTTPTSIAQENKIDSVSRSTARAKLCLLEVATRRGQKKRSGWIIARFLPWDPASPMKLAWVQTGTSTTLVSAEQLRTAMGSEQWNPSPDDIKTLKSGIKSFHAYLVEDEVGPPAPDQPIDDIINTETIEQRLGLTTLTPTIPALPSLPPLAPATPTLPPQATTTNTQGPTIQLNLQQSSTYKQTNIYQRFGAPPTPRQLTPLRQPLPPTR